MSDRRYHCHSIIFKGYVIPPPPNMRVNRKLYFDVGASDWNHGDTGSALKSFNDMWVRFRLRWDEIYAYEYGTTPEYFISTVPEEPKNHLHYQQCAVVSTPQEEVLGEKPFLPALIKREASAADYVLFKLDIDQPVIEHGTIDFILNDPDNFIDEIAWEHHSKFDIAPTSSLMVRSRRTPV